jgi:predicted amidohydrolase YtcJ
MAARRAGAADLVLRGGTVITMDAATPPATGLAVRGDRVVALGEDRAIDAWIDEGTLVVPLDGRVVVPGFIDVHTHVASNAPDPRDVDCRDFYDPSVDSVAAILDRLHGALDGIGPDDWIVGTSSPMIDARIAERRLPTKAELDAATADRPAYLTVGPHLTLANTAALAIAGIDRDGPPVSGGAIDRAADGEPTGLLREVAQQLVQRRRPGSTVDRATLIERQLRVCAKRGVTGIHDVVKHPDEVRAYDDLRSSERLPVRVQLLIRTFQSGFEPEGLLRTGIRTGFGDDLLRIGGMKMSVDGGFDQAAFQPIADDVSRAHPVLRMTHAELTDLVNAYHRVGSRLCIHAAGDLALDMALDALEGALQADPRADHRHRIEHMGNYLATAERLRRLRKLEAVPVPNASERHFLGSTADDIFDRRKMAGSFAFRSIIEAGLPLVLASDGGGLWPVDPLRDMATATGGSTRDAPGGALEDELVTRSQALAAFTTAAAWSGFDESRMGALRPGMAADLAILDADPLTCPPDALGSIGVVATIAAGRVTHSAEPLLPEGLGW